MTSVSSDRGELAAIVRSVAGGDRGAMETLYQRTSSKLFGICVRLLGSEAEAEEVLQDVYVTVWGKAASFDAAKASPITWLSVLARNRSIDRLRRRRVKFEDLDAANDIADTDPSAFDLAVQAEDRGRLADCLDELDERPRQMIRAAFVDGATYSELAKTESVPLGTMKSWIRRGLKNLRGCLER
ncbi:MAG: sigma-70 family RNA polymerase sigma factor [Sphingomicrobium sp.]